MQAQESKVASDSSSPSASKPKGPRLVIRVKITPEPAPSPPQPSISPRAVGITAAVIALLTIVWLGMNAWRDESASRPMIASPGSSSSQSAPASPNSASSAQDAASVDTAAADVSPNVQPVASATSSSVRSEPAVPEPVNEVIPDAPRSALQTITGTVRVAIRVDLDQSGKVTATHSEIPGPSRYFERLSREAAAKWMFTPTASEDMRSMLLRFYYKRDGVTAEASLPN